LEQFRGGKTTNDGSVTAKDIQSLSGKLETNLRTTKNSIIKEVVKDLDGFLLLYDETTRLDIVKTQVFAPLGSKQSSISGLALVRVHYAWVERDDLMKALKQYLDQRPSKSVSLIDIPRNSLMLYEKSSVGNSLIIPTRMNVIW
jgi:predicted nucleotide-binding protein (sugar kinase/HSP70/actin superfamily)